MFFSKILRLNREKPFPRAFALHGHTVTSSEDLEGWKKLAYDLYGENRANALDKAGKLGDGNWLSKFASLSTYIVAGNKEALENLFLNPPTSDEMLDKALNKIFAKEANFLSLTNLQMDPDNTIRIIDAICRLIQNHQHLVGVNFGREFLSSCFKDPGTLNMYVDIFKENPAFIRRFAQLLISKIYYDNDKNELKTNGFQHGFVFATLLFSAMLERDVDKALKNDLTYTLALFSDYVQKQGLKIRVSDNVDEPLLVSASNIVGFVNGTKRFVKQGAFPFVSGEEVTLDSPLNYWRDLLRSNYQNDFVLKFLEKEYPSSLKPSLKLFSNDVNSSQAAETLMQNGAEALKLAMEDYMLGVDAAGEYILKCLARASERAVTPAALYVTGAMGMNPQGGSLFFSDTRFVIEGCDQTIWTRNNITRLFKLNKGSLVHYMIGGADMCVDVRDKRILKRMARESARNSNCYGAAVLLYRACGIENGNASHLKSDHHIWLKDLYKNVEQYATKSHDLNSDDVFLVEMKFYLACHAWINKDLNGLSVLKGLSHNKDVDQFYRLMKSERLIKNKVAFYEAICMHDDLLPLIDPIALWHFTFNDKSSNDRITKPKAVLRIIAKYVESYHASIKLKRMKSLMNQLVSIQKKSSKHLSEIDLEGFNMLKEALLKKWIPAQRRSKVRTIVLDEFPEEVCPLVHALACLVGDKVLQNELLSKIDPIASPLIARTDGGINDDGVVFDVMPDGDDSSDDDEVFGKKVPFEPTASSDDGEVVGEDVSFELAMNTSGTVEEVDRSSMAMGR